MRKFKHKQTSRIFRQYNSDDNQVFDADGKAYPYWIVKGLDWEEVIEQRIYDKVNQRIFTRQENGDWKAGNTTIDVSAQSYLQDSEKYVEISSEEMIWTTMDGRKIPFSHVTHQHWSNIYHYHKKADCKYQTQLAKNYIDSNFGGIILQSKVWPEIADWQDVKVTRFRNYTNKNVYSLVKGGECYLTGSGSIMSFKTCIPRYQVFSVERISDGREFSLGQYLKDVNAAQYWTGTVPKLFGKIASFSPAMAYGKHYTSVTIEIESNVFSSFPIEKAEIIATFKTNDGIEVFPNQGFYVVGKNCQVVYTNDRLQAEGSTSFGILKNAESYASLSKCKRGDWLIRSSTNGSEEYVRLDNLEDCGKIKCLSPFIMKTAGDIWSYYDNPSDNISNGWRRMTLIEEKSVLTIALGGYVSKVVGNVLEFGCNKFTKADLTSYAYLLRQNKNIRITLGAQDITLNMLERMLLIYKIHTDGKI